MINERANRMQDKANQNIDIKNYVDELIKEAKNIDGGFSTKQIANIVQSVFGENSYNIAFTYILETRGYK